MATSSNSSSLKEEAELELNPDAQNQIQTLPIEIWSRILSYMGTSDLLNSRVVCKDWDLEVRKILRARRRHTLDISNIAAFISRAASTGYDFVKPLHVTWEIRIRAGKPCPKQFSDLDGYLNELNEWLGPGRVEALTILIEPTAKGELKPLMEFLSKHAHNLKYLELTLHIQTNLPTLDEMGLLGVFNEQYRDISFPKLTHLKCTIRAKDSAGLVEKEITGVQELIFFFIISKAGNLKMLKCDFGPHAFITIPDQRFARFSLPIHTLKTLKLIGLNKNEATGFAQAFSIYSRENRRGQLGVKTLKIDFPEWSDNSQFGSGYRDRNPIPQIIQAFEKTLTKLVVVVEGDIFTRQARLTQLPELPHLKSLKIRIKDVSRIEVRQHIKRSHLNFYPDVLPSLESMDLPVGWSFLPSETKSALQPFSSVKYLTLRATRWAFEDFQEEYLVLPYEPDRVDEAGNPRRPRALQEYIYQLQLIFPNVTNLLFVTEGTQLMEFPMDRLLMEFLVSGRAFMIQELGLITHKVDELLHAFSILNRFKPTLVLQNFPYNPELLERITQAVRQCSTLGEFEVNETKESPRRADVLGNTSFVLTFDEIQPDPKHKMTNVERLVLGRTKEKYRKTGGGCISGKMFNVNDGNLTILRKNLPSLTGVRISSELIAKKGKNIREVEIQKLLSVFPHSSVQDF